MRNKILALIIICGLFASIFKRFFIWVVIICVVLLIIRLLADAFWWGKDNDKW
jgi:hypothetical protein